MNKNFFDDFFSKIFFQKKFSLCSIEKNSPKKVNREKKIFEIFSAYLKPQKKGNPQVNFSP